MKPVQHLEASARAFGPGSSRKKLRLMKAVAGQRRLVIRDLVTLQGTLGFLRAYPDDFAVLAAAGALATDLGHRVARLPGGTDSERLLNSGLPGTTNLYAYSYGVVQQIAAAFPHSLDMDWDSLETEEPLMDVLSLLITAGECQGLEDIRISFREWLARCKADPRLTDLEFILDLFQGANLAAAERAHLYDTLDLPLLFRLQSPGTSRNEAILPTATIHYQQRDLDRSRFPLPAHIRRPLRKVRHLGRIAGAKVVRTALIALCTRNLEIYPLIYANSRDVTLVEGGRGLQVALVGVDPPRRSPLESLYFFLLIKNGIPVAYGPAAILLGCCEMGINLFPEFRGGEIRVIYAEFMRAVHHILGVNYYFLTAYGMGEDNEEALRSGAFWFYRKLGFKAANKVIETLARAEEKLMRADPTHRSDRRTLRRLSHTSAFMDLSAGRCRPLDLGRLGIAQSRFMTRRFAGDRRKGLRHCLGSLRRDLEIASPGNWSTDERDALERLAPILAMLPDLATWNRRNKKQVVAFIRAKGATSERRAASLLQGHGKLGSALRKLLATATATD